MPKMINTKAELVALAKQLGVRPDWHEPDEQGVTVTVRGTSFDNAGFWGEDFENDRNTAIGSGEKFYPSTEKYVVIKQNGKSVANVNLAVLLAFACDTYKG